MSSLWRAQFKALPCCGRSVTRAAHYGPVGPASSGPCAGLIPIALLVWAVKFTQRYPESYKARMA